MSYFTIFRLISVATLIFALIDLPYGYYTILKIIITGLACVGIYKSALINFKFFTISFAILAIIFNPLLPIRLDQDIWQFVDIITAIYLLISIYFIGNDIKIVREKSKRVIFKIKSILIWFLEVIILPAILGALIIYLVVFLYGHFNKETKFPSTIPVIDSTYVKPPVKNELLDSQNINTKLESKVIQYNLLDNFTYDSVHITRDTILMICRDSMTDKIISRLAKDDSVNKHFDILAEDTIVHYAISFWTVNFDTNFNKFPVIRAYHLKTCQGALCYQIHYYWYNKLTLVRIFLLYGDILNSKDDADISFNKSCISEWPVIFVNNHSPVRTDYFTFDDSLGYYSKVSEKPCLIE